MVSDNAKSTPIFWGHGKDDPLVRFDLGEGSAKYLTEVIGIPKATEDGSSQQGLSFNAYAGVEHSTNMQELQDLRAWIKRVLPNKDD
jgi:predicted esterase